MAEGGNLRREISQTLLLHHEEEDRASLTRTYYGCVSTTPGITMGPIDKPDFVAPTSRPISGTRNNIATSYNSDGSTNLPPTELLDENCLLLDLCREKILKPYSFAISLVGWSPLFNTDFGRTTLKKVFNCIYFILLLSLVLFGHILEYASCFRRDGFALYRESYVQHLINKNSTLFYQQTIWDVIINFITPIDNGHDLDHLGRNNTHYGPIHRVVCSGGVLSTYLIPSLLHLFAFGFSVYIMRRHDTETLSRFVELVFLQLRHFPDKTERKNKLLRDLRKNIFWFVGWVVAPVSSFILLYIYGKSSPTGLNYTWMQPKDVDGIIVLDTFLFICIILNYVICVSIAISYLFQCELILNYLSNLRLMVKLRTIDLAELYRQVNSAHAFLKHVNRFQSLGVGLISLNVASKFITALYGFVSGESRISNYSLVYFSTFIMISYWLCVLVRIINNARLVCDMCEDIKDIGHRVKGAAHSGRFRPSDSEVDSLILYMSTLNMDARIFSIPFYTKSVMKFVLFIFIVLVVLSQLGLTYFS